MELQIDEWIEIFLLMTKKDEYFKEEIYRNEFRSSYNDGAF